MKRLRTLVLAVAAGVASAATAQRLYDRPTFAQFERAIAAAEGRPYVPSPATKTDPTFDQMERLIAAVKAGGEATTNYVTWAEYAYATNMLAQAKRDKDDLAVYRKVKDIWVWSNWTNEDSTADAPADFLAAANSPGSIPLEYKAETASWMYANQYWPNGNLKYDSSMPPGGHDGPLSTNLYFKFVARDDDGRTELFRFGAMAHRESAMDDTVTNWFDYATLNYPVRLVTTDLLNQGLESETRTKTFKEAVERIADSRIVKARDGDTQKYLRVIDFSDTFDSDAEWYAEWADEHGYCTSMRYGNVYVRNYDWKYTEAMTYVGRLPSAEGRYASVFICSVGTNLTPAVEATGLWTRFHRALPGRAVDGINEKGVVCNINVVPLNGSDWETRGLRDLSLTMACRYVLDHFDNARDAADYVAAHGYVPDALKNQGFSLHMMIADAGETYIVEDGEPHLIDRNSPTPMTNYRVVSQTPDPYGSGHARYNVMKAVTQDPDPEKAMASAIQSVWYTHAYVKNADGDYPWPDEFAGTVVVTNEAGRIVGVVPEETGSPWEHKLRNDESDLLQEACQFVIPDVPHDRWPRDGSSWQTIHCSVYDISNRCLRIAVQEDPKWTVVSVPSDGAGTEIVDSLVSTSTNKALSANMGRELRTSIDAIKSRGRYLSIWDCTNGLARTQATVSPYPYKAGDYFIVGAASPTNTVVNYRPSGSAYTNGAPSHAVETAPVKANDTYYFDGTEWTLVATELPDRLSRFVDDVGFAHEASVASRLNDKLTAVSPYGNVWAEWNDGDNSLHIYDSLGGDVVLGGGGNVSVLMWDDWYYEYRWVSMSDIYSRYSEISWTAEDAQSIAYSTYDNLWYVDQSASDAQNSIYWHENDWGNPHNVTMDQVGVREDNDEFVDLVKRVNPIDAADETFSNAVVAVGFNIPTNVLHEINEIIGRGSFYSNVSYAVDCYFQSNAIKKAVLKRRAGRPGDRGTGWGYMLYDWTSDIRVWRLNVPTVSALAVETDPASRTTNAVFQIRGTDGVARPVEVLDYPTSPLVTDLCDLKPAYEINLALDRTAGEFGSDGCAAANYVTDLLTAKVGGTPFARAYASVSAEAIAPAALVTLPGGLDQDLTVTRTEVVVAQWLGDVTLEMAFRLHGFALAPATDLPAGSDGVVLSYAYEATVTATGDGVLDGRQVVTVPAATASVVFAIQQDSTDLAAIEVPGHRMATVSSSHYYYDAGLDATMVVECTNGCFYARKIADGDVSNDESADFR